MPLGHVHEEHLGKADRPVQRSDSKPDKGYGLHDGQSCDAKPTKVGEQLVHQGPFLKENRCDSYLGTFYQKRFKTFVIIR